jgi:plastocyanin
VSRRTVRTIAGVAAAIVVFACGSDTTAAKNDFSSVTVTPSDAELFVGTLWPHMHQTATHKRGGPVTGPMEVVWSSSDASRVAVDASTGAISGVANGTADVTATVTVEGVTHSGSSQVTVTDASPAGGVTATTAARFTPQLITVARSGAAATVTWTFQSVAHTVTWDSQPAGATVADIPATSGTSIARDFTVPGEYEFHCTIHSGMTGSVLVQ